MGFVENLVRYSLGGGAFVEWPASRGEVMGKALGIVDRMLTMDATVEDAAEATLRLYTLAMSIPNVVEDSLDESEWQGVEPMEPGNESLPMDAGESGGEGSPVANGRCWRRGAARSSPTAAVPQPVDFRGEFKPELVQLLMKLREDAQMGGDAGEMSPQQLTPEQLAELMEKSAEIDLDAMMEGDLDSTTGMFMSKPHEGSRAPLFGKGPQRGESDE